MTTKEIVKDQEFIEQASALILEAQSIKVDSQESFERAVEFGKGCSSFIKRVEAFFDPMKKAAKAAHSAVCAREKEVLKSPIEADEIVKKTANAWKAEQKRRDEENLRIEQERVRVEAEARRKAEIKMLKDMGEGVAAKELKKAALVIPEAEVAPVFTKVAGTRNRVEWHFEVTDQTSVPDQFWMIDERALRDYVKAMREKALPGGGFEIAGVRVWSTEETDW